MKIVHISMFYKPTIGGVEQVIYEIARRQVKAGHEVHVFCCDSDKYKRVKIKEEVLEGIHVHRMPYWFRLSLNTFIWPSLLWKFKGNFDIVHSHVSGHLYVLIAGLLARIRKTGHIHTTHCPWTDYKFRPKILRPFVFLNNLIMNRISFSLIDKIIAITPWELETLEKFADKKKVVVIPNGVDGIYYKKIKKNNFKKDNGIKEDKLVLFFGRLNPTKGPEKLALAALEISKKRKDIAFVWVGPDEGKLEEVKSLIKGKKNMLYLEPIRDKKKVAEMYQAANVFVLPSYREGLPLTLFEAMASGLPIVASPVNGVPYEMKENKNGFFSDYGDIESLEKNILKLLDNKELTEKISKNNFKRSAAYNWDRIYISYMKEYKRLLKKSIL